jgi:predicted secreted protein
MTRRSLYPMLLAACLVLASFAARADEPRLPPDTVTLFLSAEGWVEASNARLIVAVDSALAGGEAGALRSRLKGSLAKLVPDAEWHVTDFDRSRDQAGLERWHLQAEARVKETALDGLYERAKSQSKPGEQLSIVSVDFTPAAAEREQVTAELRAKLYAAAKEELARLATIYPDRTYRLREMQFGPQGPMPMGMPPMKMARAGAIAETAPASPEPIGVAEHVELNASVVLAADPPKKQE